MTMHTLKILVFQLRLWLLNAALPCLANVRSQQSSSITAWDILQMKSLSTLKKPHAILEYKENEKVYATHAVSPRPTKSSQGEPQNRQHTLSRRYTSI